MAPVSLGTRACASAWWVFALVVTSSYTANLAGLLAATRSENDVHSVEELADTAEPIGVGAKAGGSTYTLFEVSHCLLPTGGLISSLSVNHNIEFFHNTNKSTMHLL